MADDLEIIKRAKDFLFTCESLQADECSMESLRGAIKFIRSGEQWTAAELAARSMSGFERPAIVINRLLQFRNQVVNELKSSTPQIKYRPGQGGSPEAAEIRSDLVKHIEYQGKADIAYDTAVGFAVDCGVGYIRLALDYVDDTSFDKEPTFIPIHDPTTVWYDPLSSMVDGSDCAECLIETSVGRKVFEREYPDADPQGWAESARNDVRWVTDEQVTIADYFYLEYKSDTLLLFEDGSTALRSELSADAMEMGKAYIVSKRKVTTKVVNHCKLTSGAVLEKATIPGKYIPIIPVYGEMWVIDGKRHVKGLTQAGREAQRLLNFWKSASAEATDNAIRAPFIAAAGAFTGHENSWNAARKLPIGRLEYNPISIAGNLAPSPRREPFAGPPTALLQQEINSIDDLKASLGMWDATIGQNENEQSGRAIGKLQAQASIGNFHYADNRSKSIAHCGQIISDWIPIVYKTAEVARIVKKDGDSDIIKLDSSLPTSYAEIEENGKKTKVYNLTRGKYDTVVDVGPSYATKSMEDAELLNSAAQSNPALLDKAGDIYFKAQGKARGSDVFDQVGERLKKFLPPGVADDTDKDGDEDPQILMMMNQMSQQMEQLSQRYQQVMDELEDKKAELAIKQFEAETKRLAVTKDLGLIEGKTHQIAIQNAQLIQPEAEETEVDDNE